MLYVKRIMSFLLFRSTGNTAVMELNYSAEVMDITTRLRKSWNLKYPEEIW